MAIGSEQADIDRLSALATQAGDELRVLKDEVDALNVAGVDTTKAKAAADALEQTLATVQGHAAEITLSGSDADTASTAALAAVPSGATVDRVETDEFGKKEVHVSYADGSKHVVKLDANGNVTAVQDGDDDAAPAPPGAAPEPPVAVPVPETPTPPDASVPPADGGAVPPADGTPAVPPA